MMEGQISSFSKNAKKKRRYFFIETPVHTKRLGVRGWKQKKEQKTEEARIVKSQRN